MNAGEASEYPSRLRDWSRRRKRLERLGRSLPPKRFTTSDLNRVWRQAHRDDRPRAMAWMRHPMSGWRRLGLEYPAGYPVDFDGYGLS